MPMLAIDEKNESGLGFEGCAGLFSLTASALTPRRIAGKGVAQAKRPLNECAVRFGFVSCGTFPRVNTDGNVAGRTEASKDWYPGIKVLGSRGGRPLAPHLGLRKNSRLKPGFGLRLPFGMRNYWGFTNYAH